MLRILLVIITIVPSLILCIDKQYIILKKVSDDNFDHRKLFWGTYKPHLISAITQKTPNPITIGMMYHPFLQTQPQKFLFLSTVRHKIVQQVKNHFIYHNGIDFSLQQLEDDILEVKANITHIKREIEN